MRLTSYFVLLIALYLAYQSSALSSRVYLQFKQLKPETISYLNNRIYNSLVDTTPANNTKSGNDTEADAPKQDPRAKVAKVIRAYLNNDIFENLLMAVFKHIDKDNSGEIDETEFQTVMKNEKIDAEDAERLWYIAQIDKLDSTLNWVEFVQVAELGFHESISMVAFGIITNSDRRDPFNVISFETLTTSVQILWSSLDEEKYPTPDENKIKKIFDQCNHNNDATLDMQEFFWFFSILLKHYKSIAENYHFMRIIAQDNHIQLAWQNVYYEQKRSYLYSDMRITVKNLFKYGMFSFAFEKACHDYFTRADTDHSDQISRGEFNDALQNEFRLTEDELDFLFHIGDADGSGEIDYPEFCHLFQTLIHRIIAKFGWKLIHEDTPKPSLDNVVALVEEMTKNYQLSASPSEEVKNMLKELNVTMNATLTYPTFASLVSAVLNSIKSSIDQDANKAIETNAALDTNDQNKVARSAETVAFDEDTLNKVKEAEKNDKEDQYELYLLEGGEDQGFGFGAEGGESEGGEEYFAVEGNKKLTAGHARN